MGKNNQWTRGPIELELPPLPSELKDISGCLLQTGTFDDTVGEEVFLVILDTAFDWRDPEDEEGLELRLKSGIAQTGHGLLAFLIWVLVENEERAAYFEQYLDPENPDTLRLLTLAGEQDFLKVVFCNSGSGLVEDFLEYENVYELGDLGATLAEMEDEVPEPSFEDAQQEFMTEYPVEDLLDEEEDEDDEEDEDEDEVEEEDRKQ
ncbi:MAG TPA: hypothetical protein VLQ45_17755 [Thermoanaerobaculia bacterium]|nr:hypothetical protein [Thermoanaerobaculia bacterium]